MLRDAYCSAPPIELSIRPRLSRETETVRPRVPLRPVKKEVRESEASSVEFVFDDADEAEVKVEAPVMVEEDPRLAVRIRQPATTASSSSEDVAGPSGTAYRTQALRRIPSGQLDPRTRPEDEADPKGQSRGRESR